jgi:FAD/FMN-containing dehydrogenase
MTHESRTPDPAVLDRFAQIVGDAHALRDPADTAPYLVELRGLYQGRTPMVLRPGSVSEVSEILKLATATGTAIVPQGGNTGLVGGQVPDESGHEIVVSLARLDRIRALDVEGNTVVAEAGVILKSLQDEAERHGRLFPLSLASEGSCRIGGNLSSNAGGTAVLAYGNMRDLCLGLEVVLPTGEVLDDLRLLRKDNTGYDLKDLFIGAEGTLGIITAASLKLFPIPKGRAVAYAGLASPQAALALFAIAREHGGPSLTGFELLPRIGVEFTVRHMPGVRDPLESPHDWYVLLDISSSRSSQDARETIEAILTEGLERGLVDDAVIAESIAQEKAFWHLRESMSEAQRYEGGSIKHDISVPVASVPAFMDKAGPAVLAMIPGARICAFGHMGDGNLHYNISQPVGADKADFLARWYEVNDVVHAIVAEFRGSISAEHGIGRLKRDELAHVKSPVALALMHRLKQAFDPAGIMNPGKVL